MLALKKIAVTGGLASGKTTVCSYLKELGAYVVSADEIVHRLLSPETEVGKKVVAYLGLNHLKRGKIDRKEIAELVFPDIEKLKGLEKLIHPAVLSEIERAYNRIKNQKEYSFFLAEIPLLYELGWESFFDEVITVVAQDALCKERYQKMAAKGREDFEKRMARQMILKEKKKRGGICIENDGTLEQLKQKILEILFKLR
ncbi:MAG: dephospho-CoA kinase [Chlamydiae bacterium RIFCSPLOWO2_12_FULL_49_12]|nr:MAG: dephospho-CoA kinase [Chlamydiae bacterium RIFCSPHIGHO2_02_FULL_49_29]OGN62558.1 MAG: dephospho-CoA kinase [Chlamydiae bacterium RIFCSPHIGHO2_12_FULL_49_32]OGN68416.1 MAG: dephospho-CoA kinase [Chlamydiae bacterium RIFCSPLOWO2_02_FULL_49_12]OGN73964.1 MAG: dephospho-CoA kinase [Chlamydiae bacterium RIFCSPLOWO2_12_FULL_49_12]